MDRSPSTPPSSSSTSSAVAKRLWHILRVVLYMIRKGFTKQKLINLLLKRGKTAGKAIGNLMAFLHHHHTHGGGNGGSRRQYYNPKEVEFSCSNTPSFFPFHKDHRRHDGELDATMIAKAFEILNSAETTSDGESSVMPSPSVTPLWSLCWKSPAAVVARQLRITDSPFAVLKEEEEEVDGHVDKKAEEFIKRFYENLQLQQRIPETPLRADWRRRRDAAVTCRN